MATEFTVYLEDRPGVLAGLTEALAKNAVNIVAMHATPCPTTGIVQFITNNPDATITALRDAALDYTVQEVLVVSLAHEPGSMARLARAFGDEGVNINAIYMTIEGQTVIDVNDLRKAQQIVLNLGLR